MATAKGGSGKSTLAIALAVAAQEAGEQVCLIDLDPQQSAMHWAERRDERQGKSEPLVLRASPAELRGGVPALADQGVSLAIIDTAGRDESETGLAVGMADGCLIPVKTSILDLESCVTTAERLQRLKKPFFFVINEAEPKAGNARNLGTRQALEEAFDDPGLIAKAIIVRRNDHRDAIDAGLGVSELHKKGKAADEVRALWEEARLLLERRVADVA